MPLTSVYDIGTVAFTNGSPTVTGTGTSWIGAGIREGDLFWANGLTVRVLALVSNTELTLAHNWPGASNASSAYEIQYTTDASRVLAKSNQILNELDGTGINPLKNITPENNKLLYYTGAATAALTDLTEKARNILALDTNEEVRTELGIAFQASRYETVANKVLRTGSFGLGAISVEPVTDINSTSLPSAIMGVNPATVSGTLPPLTGSTDAILNIGITANISHQLYFSTHTTSPVYSRRSTGSGVWGDWKLITME